jgi:succinoglycan biosynthesis protein ExoA
VSDLRARCAGSDHDRHGWPTVSVVVPVRNEAAHLERAVASILAQDYPMPFDVCLAVAPSGDGTEEIAARLAAEEARVTVVPNPSGATPAGLNAAIRATSGEIVVRVDAHARLSPGYVRRAVETMCRTGAVNVGGRQVPEPETPFERAVAEATTSWMGTGGATYRIGGIEGPVDTVYLGVFDRAAGDAVGWFDESLIRNQDYELNIRLRRAGGAVWFDPELWVGYRPRGTWTALARQYYEYGWWKAEVLRRHPESLRLRQVVPPVVITTAFVGGGVGLRWRPGLLAPLCYLVAAAVAGAAARRALVAPVLITMHTSWTAGILRHLVRRNVAR